MRCFGVLRLRSSQSARTTSLRMTIFVVVREKVIHKCLPQGSKGSGWVDATENREDLFAVDVGMLFFVENF